MYSKGKDIKASSFSLGFVLARHSRFGRGEGKKRLEDGKQRLTFQITILNEDGIFPRVLERIQL